MAAFGEAASAAIATGANKAPTHVHANNCAGTRHAVSPKRACASRADALKRACARSADVPKRACARSAAGRKIKFSMMKSLVIRSSEPRSESVKTRCQPARDSGEGGSGGSIRTIGNETDKGGVTQHGCDLRRRCNSNDDSRRDRQGRSQITRCAMLAIMFGSRCIRLLRLVTGGHRLVCHRHLRHLRRRTRPLMRKRATQHRSGRKRLHRQHQHHQQDQKAFKREAHARSVVKKV